MRHKENPLDEFLFYLTGIYFLGIAWLLMSVAIHWVGMQIHPVDSPSISETPRIGLDIDQLGAFDPVCLLRESYGDGLLIQFPNQTLQP